MDLEVPGKWHGSGHSQQQDISKVQYIVRCDVAP